ncbi:MAG: ATP-binding protein [Ferruginibacter sp.]
MKKAFTITILLLFFCGTIFSQVGGTDQLRDSLNHELIIAKDDTSRVLIMADLSMAYVAFNADTFNLYANKALKLAQRLDFFRGEASALNSLGLGVQIEGEYPKSLEYLYRGLGIAEGKHYVFETAVCYAIIGNAYWFLGDYTKTISFEKKSQDLLKTIINQRSVSEWMLFNNLNIGQAYLEYNLDSAYTYLKQYYDATMHDKFWHPVALYNLGDCLFRQSDRETPFNYVRESIAGATVNGDYLTEADACATISGFFKTIQEADSAIYYANRGLTAANSIAYGLGIYRNSKLLAVEYEQLNVQEALHYRKFYDSVNERMYGAKKVQELQKTLAEEQLRQQQIQKMQFEKENRLKQYGFIAGLAIMIMIAFILYRNNLQRKKTNILLQHQKEKVEATLSELKSTQSQLIQSEKMASLGELTAGIAHEIQNPLNFVNNFSEVNKELLFEMKDEMKKGNWEDANAIANDIIDNEEKINHHGKRADAIVKGMLQHSQKSSGQKEPTEINALCDEYLRLSYHGLRAKDKNFNAGFKTDFDKSIGKIDIIPQDIGRVLLNLYNNAFYAVQQKQKESPQGLPTIEKLATLYEPTVSISTKNLGDKIEIKVADNGNGIPQKIIDKIFQPFFTTKPTGQGTGLGLSLSYDIIKAHGGEIKVETKENEGTTFIIQLPA